MIWPLFADQTEPVQLLTMVFTDGVESRATQRDVSRERAYLGSIQKRHFIAEINKSDIQFPSPTLRPAREHNIFPE